DAAVTSMAEVLERQGRQAPEMTAVMDAVVAAFARTFPVDIPAAQHAGDRLAALAGGAR
ncbi:MAG: hypothetical protein IIC21_00685, partial [Chloroflexi bacterium]|nr:hypothetical protein [Chloroflexota bacterium]